MIDRGFGDDEVNVEAYVAVLASDFPLHDPAACEEILVSLPLAVRFLAEMRAKRTHSPLKKE